MNEKIKELAEQAGFYIDSEPIINDSNNPRLEKFAEMIVEEATDLVRNMLDQNTAGEVIVEIKQHFGVL